MFSVLFYSIEYLFIHYRHPATTDTYSSVEPTSHDTPRDTNVIASAREAARML